MLRSTTSDRHEDQGQKRRHEEPAGAHLAALAQLVVAP